MMGISGPQIVSIIIILIIFIMPVIFLILLIKFFDVKKDKDQTIDSEILLEKILELEKRIDDIQGVIDDSVLLDEEESSLINEEEDNNFKNFL